ncbi:hypothetical protein [Rhizomonospora bruguierae]|uniref:hypothetical protein n=1 Tax=Rhizomonospora bruguierae TaxID=1581705 RepID=UPI0020C15089|nr:hypothetical protein [Micromonospora sp. NBRC 107566]
MDIATNRLIHDPRTREYAARRTATSSSRKEIIRILERYIVRQVFPEIRRALTPPQSSPQTARHRGHQRHGRSIQLPLKAELVRNTGP